jgi:very-short-patch-repair endonuclease
MAPWKKDAARAMRNHPTEAEAVLWQRLRCHRLDGYKFNRQARMYGYIADFYCPRLKLVVEVDGSIHRTPGQQAADRLRDANLTARGMTVVRVTNADVLHTAYSSSAKARIRRAIDQILKAQDMPLEHNI